MQEYCEINYCFKFFCVSIGGRSAFFTVGVKVKSVALTPMLLAFDGLAPALLLGCHSEEKRDEESLETLRVHLGQTP
jgi:hypothetical protein